MVINNSRISAKEARSGLVIYLAELEPERFAQKVPGFGSRELFFNNTYYKPLPPGYTGSTTFKPLGNRVDTYINKEQCINNKT